jgi:hypothetical protein
MLQHAGVRHEWRPAKVGLPDFIGERRQEWVTFENR